MTEFDVVDLTPETTTSIGFLDKDEEIRVAAATIAANSQATGEYKPSATSIIQIARRIEEYIRSGR